MAEGKKSVLLYCDLIHTVNKLPDETAGKLFKHYLAYINDLNPITEDLLVEVAFEGVKQSLKRDLIKYEERAERSRKNGGLGGRPKGNPTEPKKPSGLIKNPDEPEKPDRDSVSVTDSDSDSDTVKDIKKNNTDKSEELVFKKEHFEIFWNTYEKKEGKKKCLAKFLTIKKEDIIKITEVTNKYVKSTPDSQYRKNPLTWLNGEHWNDEIIIKRNYEQSTSNNSKPSVTEVYRLNHEQNAESHREILLAQRRIREAKG